MRKSMDAPEWTASLAARLDHLRRLPVGWDGYDAPPVRGEIADLAAHILEAVCGPGTPAPSAVPGTSGDLQIEWHTQGWDIEIDVLETGHIEAWRRNLASLREDELRLTNDFTEVRTWVAQLEEPTLASRAATA